MGLLLLGLLLWVSVHLFPSVCKTARAGIVAKMGLMRYKGVFALLIVASIVLIVFGWRGMTPEQIYNPPAWGRHVTYLLVLVTFILFVAAKHKNNIKRVLRHPQMTVIVIWSIGHLLANGDNRSLILFTTLGLWAIAEIILINKREGAWVKPEPVPVKKDVITVVAGSVVYIVLALLHPYFTGVKLV